MTLPCPKCGSKNIVSTFCANCLKELNPLLKSVKDPKLSFCVSSNKVQISHGWEDLSPQDAIIKVIENNLKLNPEAIIENIDYEFPEIPDLSKPGLKIELLIGVIITGRVTTEMKSYEETYDIPVKIETTVSPKFAKVGTEYFEGIYQARNEKEEHKKYLKNIINRQKDRGQAINKEEPVKNGTDYYIVKKQLFHTVAQEIADKFGGRYKMTRKLFSYNNQKSKNIYRVTWLVEFPPFEKGDIFIDEKNRILKLKEFGKKIHFENIATGKQVFEEYEKDKFTLIPQITTTISQIHPQVTVLDPDTYQPIPVRNRFIPDLKPGAEVKIVTIKNKTYLARW